MPPKREAPKAEAKAEANEKKKVNVEGQTTGQSGLSAIESIYHDRLPQGRALNRWDAEAERDLIMACLTSENNNYPTINWPRVKLIMDDRGYKFSRSALDQRWSKSIMKDWREHRGPGTLTDFVDPDTANNTPARKRGRILAVAKAKQNERIAAALAARNLANSQAESTPVDNTLAESSPVDNGLAGNAIPVRRRVDSGHLTRSLETRVFGTAAADADDAEDVGGDTKYLMQPPPTPATAVDKGPASETTNKPSPSPGDLLFLQQCDQFRVEEGNEIAEEPPRKRRAPRRSKAEMEKAKADKEAARIKREEERARKLAALNGKTSATPKAAVKKENNVVNLITPPRPAPATPAATGVVEIEDDYDPNLLYQMPRSVTMATPTFGARGSTVAPPSVRSTATATPGLDNYGFSQGFNPAMSYPTPSTNYSVPSGNNYATPARNGSIPSRNAPLPSFQTNFGMEPSAAQRGYGYPMRQNASFSNNYAYGMMGQYTQPMNFNYGMPQNGYAQSSYSMNQDPIFNLAPIYGNTGNTGNTGQTGSDARVLFGDSPANQPAATERQSAMTSQQAPLAPMDIIPSIESDNDQAGPATDKAT